MNLSESGADEKTEPTADVGLSKKAKAEVIEADGSHRKLPARRLYPLHETRQLLGDVDDKTVRRWIQRGLLKRSTASRHILVPSESIEQFVKDTCK